MVAYGSLMSQIESELLRQIQWIIH